MKKKYILLVSLLCFILLCSVLLIVLIVGHNKKIKLNGITTNKSEIVLNVGDKESIEYELSPKEASSDVIWSSSNENVATVYNGEVVAINVGSTTITITCSKNEEIKTTVKVNVVARKYNITYVLNEGTFNEDVATKYEENKGLETLPEPTREGYEFEGWYLDDNLVTSISSTLNKDVTLVAKWSKVVKVFTITYVLNGGYFTEDVLYKYEENKGLETLPEPKREGYEFAGWYLDNILVTSISSTLNKDVTLVAKWVVVEELVDKSAAALVDAYITVLAIDSSNITKTTVDNISEMYDALSDNEKKLVTKYNILVYYQNIFKQQLSQPVDVNINVSLDDLDIETIRNTFMYDFNLVTNSNLDSFDSFITNYNLYMRKVNSFFSDPVMIAKWGYLLDILYTDDCTQELKDEINNIKNQKYVETNNEFDSDELDANVAIMTSNKDIKDEFDNLAYVDLSKCVNPKTFGAKGDGKTDDTYAIQKALDYAYNNASGKYSYIYIEDGIYMINAEITLYPHSNQVIILHEEAILRAIPTYEESYTVIDLFEVDNVIISGGKIEGEKDKHLGDTGEWGNGISIGACDNIIISGVEISNCWGDSIGIGYSYVGRNKPSGTNSRNIQILNCKLHHNRRQGISITGGSDILIQGCEIHDIAGTKPEFGIDIEPDQFRDGNVVYATGHAINITIDSCNIYNCAGGSVVVAYSPMEIRDIKITNCNLGYCVNNYRNNGDFGNNNFKNNIVWDNNTITSMALAGDNVLVTNCEISKLVMDSGSGTFINCSFKNDGEKSLITYHRGNYKVYDKDGNCIGLRTTELYFDNCDFEITDNIVNEEIVYFMEGGALALYENKLPDKLIKFTNCNIEIGKDCRFTNATSPEELIFDSCNVEMKGVILYALGIGYCGIGNKLIISNSNFVCPNSTYLVYFSSGNGYEVNISNSNLSSATYLFGCDKPANGNIKLTDNVINKKTCMNMGDFTITESDNIGYLTKALGYLLSGSNAKDDEDVKADYSTEQVQQEILSEFGKFDLVFNTESGLPRFDIIGYELVGYFDEAGNEVTSVTKDTENELIVKYKKNN